MLFASADVVARSVRSTARGAPALARAPSDSTRDTASPGTTFDETQRLNDVFEKPLSVMTCSKATTGRSLLPV